MNKQLAISTALATATLLFSAAPSYAAVTCVNQAGVVIYGGTYGAGTLCTRTGELQINKEVFNPNSKVNKFVDNITLENPDTRFAFAPGEEVKFRLKIKNTGDNVLNKVTVADTLPSFLEQADGQFTFDITDLQPGQTVERELKARVVAVNKLANDKTMFCDVNRAEAVSGSMSDRDTSNVCAEKKAPGELPKAGATDTFAVLASSGLFGYFGLRFLRAGKTVKA
mgnify:CR=1 FL=1